MFAFSHKSKLLAGVVFAGAIALSGAGPASALDVSIGGENGINASVERVPYNRYGATVSGQAPFYMDGYFARPTLDTSTYPWFHSTGSWNTRMWHYSSEKMDAVLDKARETTDEAELRDLYNEMQQILVDEVPGVIMYSMNFVTAYTDKLKGYETHPYLWMDLSEAYIED